MEEDINRLRDMRLYYKDIYREYEDTIKNILNELDRLQKENEELHKEIDRMKSLDIYKLVEDWETGQLIPRQKIKDKIEELKQEKKKYGNCLIEMYEDELVNRDIKILQELLKESEE